MTPDTNADKGITPDSGGIDMASDNGVIGVPRAIGRSVTVWGVAVTGPITRAIRTVAITGPITIAIGRGVPVASPITVGRVAITGPITIAVGRVAITISWVAIAVTVG
jgi:hypothetical protein